MPIEPAIDEAEHEQRRDRLLTSVICRSGRAHVAGAQDRARALPSPIPRMAASADQATARHSRPDQRVQAAARTGHAQRRERQQHRP